MTRQWAIWVLVAATVGWLLLFRRLDLLLVVVPVSVVLSYATARARKRRKNRM